MCTLPVSPFNVPPMYLCLGLTIWDQMTYQEACPWGKLIPPPLSLIFHWFPEALHVGVGPWEVVPWCCPYANLA